MAHCCALRCLTELEAPRIAETCCSPIKAFSALILACCKKKCHPGSEGERKMFLRVSECRVHKLHMSANGRRKVLGWRWQAASEQRGGCRAKTKTYEFRILPFWAAQPRHPHRPLLVKVVQLYHHLQGKQRDHLTHQKLQGNGLEGCH